MSEHGLGAILHDNDTLRAKVASLTAQVAHERSQSEAAINEVWDDVLRAVQRAWPTPRSYGDCPTELIAELIDERDALTAQVETLRRERDEARGAENVLSAPMAAGLLLALKAECEKQHARAEAAEAKLAALLPAEGRTQP